MEGIVRKYYRFFGRVQGVGFRFRARTVANSLGIVGCVENKTDGSVEMEAQGSEKQLDEMLKALNRGAFISIDRIESKYIDVKENDKSFHIFQDW